MNADIKANLILKMAKSMQRGFWSGNRPHEKRLVTLAGYAFNALESDPHGREILDKAAKQMNLLEYKDQPKLPL